MPATDPEAFVKSAFSIMLLTSAFELCTLEFPDKIWLPDFNCFQADVRKQTTETPRACFSQVVTEASGFVLHASILNRRRPKIEPPLNRDYNREYRDTGKENKTTI